MAMRFYLAALKGSGVLSSPEWVVMYLLLKNPA